MDARRLNAQVDHSPPESGSGGSTRNWLKVTGIGCAIVLLVGGIVLGVVLWQTATCCVDIGKTAEEAEQAQFEARLFATSLHEGDYEAAYDQLSDTARQEVSLSEFESTFAEIETELQVSEPFPVQLDVEAQDIDVQEFGDLQKLRDIDRWELVTFFGPPQFEQVRMVRLVAEVERHEEDDLDVQIVEWETSRADFSFRDHPYADVARTFQDHIESNDYEDARELLSYGSDLRSTSESRFERTIEPVASALQGAETTEIEGLYPGESPNSAIVRMRLVDEQGGESTVDYRVDAYGDIVGVDGPAEQDSRAADEQTDDEPVDEQNGDEADERGEDLDGDDAQADDEVN